MAEDKKYTYLLSLVKRLFAKISSLERDNHNLQDISQDRLEYINKLEDTLYELKCPICGQIMTIVSKIDKQKPNNKGETKIQEIIISCHHIKK